MSLFMGKHVVNCKESSDANYLFYYYYYYYFGCAGSFAARVGFLWLQQVGATLWLRCSGFSLQQLLLLLGTGWRVLRLQELWHMGLAAPQLWDLPRPGIKPAFPAPAGRFLTTEPPGKSSASYLNLTLYKRIENNAKKDVKFLQKHVSDEMPQWSA